MGSIIVVELEYTDHGSWVSSHAKRHRERERGREEESNLLSSLMDAYALS